MLQTHYKNNDINQDIYLLQQEANQPYFQFSTIQDMDLCMEGTYTNWHKSNEDNDI